MALISIMEYAALHGRAAISVQQKARRGGFKTAKKIGRNWVIDSEEPYSDDRHGSPDNVVRTRVCRQCGREFPGGPRSWYCPECREIRKLSRKKTDNFKYTRGLTRKLGSTDYCANCGKAYIVSGGLQKYCPECAAELGKSLDRTASLQYYEDNKDTINPARNDRRQLKTKTCVICGKEFPSDGTVRNTCSDECRKKQQQIFQRRADKKRGK